MKNSLRCALTLSAALMACSISGADKAKDGATPVDPAYDTATTVDVTATVTEVREVAKDKAMSGLHLTLQSGGDALDVYIGPAEFVKVFDFTFVKGDKVQVIGSKVKFEGAIVVLAREATVGKVTLMLRDKTGEPLWRFFMRPPQG